MQRKGRREGERPRMTRGGLVLMGGSGTRQAGAISIADVVAPHSEVAISRLKQLNLQVMLLSGDHRLTAEAVGHSLGISKAMAEVMPDEKQQVVRRLPDQGEVVAMVEDKINDAPALAAADLGVASGAAADVAMEAADVVLVYSNLGRPGECPRHDPDTIALSHTTLRTVGQNLGWAFGYNTLLIPLAAVGLLPPVAAAAAMALSSVSVVANSLLLC